MSTGTGFINFLSDGLMHIPGITLRKMFWEYALYKDGVVVWLICDDTFFLKITPSTKELLWENYQTGLPYPKAKPQFMLDEWIIEDKELIQRLIENCKDDVAKKR